MSPERRFPNEAVAVTEARHYVLDAIGTVEPALADAIAVMVSELTTNAVRHAATYFTVSVDRTGDQIRIAVTDRGAGSPTVRSPDAGEPTGRGLQIVQALASDWGVMPAGSGPGKTVWFSVSVEPSVDDAPQPAQQVARPHERHDSYATGVSWWRIHRRSPRFAI